MLINNKQSVLQKSCAGKVIKKCHFKILLNCKSSDIYLLECLKCQLQYVGKSETEFNIRLKNYTKDDTRKYSISESNHFDIGGHKFDTHVKFILIEQLNQKNLDKLTLRKRFKIRENLWILKLKNLYSKGLNREFNKLDTTHFFVQLLNSDF